MKKYLSFFLTIAMTCMMLEGVVYASGSDSPAKIAAIIPRILNAVAYVGYAVSLGMLIFIGTKYTLSAANEKADLKQGSVSYLIGIVFIFSASAIANIVSLVAMSGTASDAAGLAGTIIDAAINKIK